MCKNCDYFRTYQFIYDDELEDFETGICMKTSSHVSFEDSCDDFKEVSNV